MAECLNSLDIRIARSGFTHRSEKPQVIHRDTVCIGGRISMRIGHSVESIISLHILYIISPEGQVGGQCETSVACLEYRINVGI